MAGIAAGVTDRSATSTTDPDVDPDVDPDEETRERYRELLEELRTILPGVQVLFAFLLTVPFSSGFGDLDELGRDLYAVVLVGVGLATVVFLTPAAFHRMGADGSRAARLRVGIRCAVAGMVLMAVSIVTAVFTVARFVFDTGVALALAGVIAAAFLALWFGLGRFRRLGRRTGA